jgi:hypothetical protein
MGVTNILDAEIERRLKAATNETEMAQVRDWFLDHLCDDLSLGTKTFYELTPLQQWLANDIHESYHRWRDARLAREHQRGR